jgi:hypothetical protein
VADALRVVRTGASFFESVFPDEFRAGRWYDLVWLAACNRHTFVRLWFVASGTEAQFAKSNSAAMGHGGADARAHAYNDMDSGAQTCCCVLCVCLCVSLSNLIMTLF